MNKHELKNRVEGLIAEQQKVQMSNPPTSEAWKRASKELHRLVRIIKRLEKGK